MFHSIFADKTVFICSVICFVAFGGFLAWAGFVKLDEGVTASGTVVVEDSRRVIQHLEGGIIEVIAVQEGTFVQAGDTLVILQNAAGQAARAELVSDYIRLEAANLRREAQAKGATKPTFDGFDGHRLAPGVLAAILLRETELFDQETGGLNAEIKTLSERAQRAKASAGPILEQQKAMRIAATALEDQLSRKRTLAELKLVRLDEVRELERSLASTQSEIARFQNEVDRARADSADFRNQISQVRAQFRTRLAEERVEAERQMQVIGERLVAAQDLVDRTVISAPTAGEVLNLTATTLGGVVKPGDPILEIVPLSNSIIASVNIRPADRASVSEGLKVRARISAFDNRDMPELTGEIIDISGDLKTDPATRSTYYEARIRIVEQSMSGRSKDILPGLPIDVFIFSGAERTTLEHLFDPLAESMFAGLRGR